MVNGRADCAIECEEHPTFIYHFSDLVISVMIFLNSDFHLFSYLNDPFDAHSTPCPTLSLAPFADRSVLTRLRFATGDTRLSPTEEGDSGLSYMIDI